MVLLVVLLVVLLEFVLELPVVVLMFHRSFSRAQSTGQLWVRLKGSQKGLEEIPVSLGVMACLRSPNTGCEALTWNFQAKSWGHLFSIPLSTGM